MTETREQKVGSGPRENTFQAGGRLEIVCTGRQPHEIAKIAWDVLVARNSQGQPFMLRRRHEIVRMILHPELDSIHVAPFTSIWMFMILTDHFNWMRITKRGEKVATKPPSPVRALMRTQPDPRLPLLSDVMAELGYEPNPGFSYDMRKRAREDRALIYRRINPKAGASQVPYSPTWRPNNRG